MNGYYALAAVSLVGIGVAVWLLMDHDKNVRNVTRAIADVEGAMADGIITREEAPGLASLIDSGAIHTEAYRYRSQSGAAT